MVICSMSNFDHNKTQCNYIWSLEAQIYTILILLVIRLLEWCSITGMQQKHGLSNPGSHQDMFQMNT